MAHSLLDAARPVTDVIAGFALPGVDEASQRDRPDRPLEPRDFAALLARCTAEGTIGILSAAVSTGWLPATDDQVAEVDDAHATLMAAVVALEQDLVTASRVLRAAAVGHRLLKGSAHACLDWPEPSMRTYSDVDILVAGDYDAGLRALARAGYERRTVEVHRGFDQRFGKGTTLVNAVSHEVDVHRTLATGAYGLLIKMDELLEGGEALSIGGCHLLALARPQRLVHACYHVALGDLRARHAMLRDVAELTLRCEPAERRQALGLARSWGGSAPVAAAINACAGLLPLPAAHPVVRWAKAYEPTATERRRLRAYTAADSSFGAQAIEGWRVLPTVGDRLAYATQLLFVDPDHLRLRGESAGRRWARGIRLASRRVRR